MVHLSEISTLILENTQISLSNYLLKELIDNKIKVVLCDEKHNPYAELNSYYGSHNTAKRVQVQAEWKEKTKKLLHTHIIKNKILNQAKFLQILNMQTYKKLEEYASEIEIGDSTNREGHSAKVYFNSLFKKTFTREQDNDINSALNYGYSIILSCFNREIEAMGYVTQLGINHKNEYNEFNLSCDLMEPFRIVVDNYVFLHKNDAFNSEYKHNLVDLLNCKKKFKNKEMFLSGIIREYINCCTQFLNGETEDYSQFEI